MNFDSDDDYEGPECFSPEYAWQEREEDSWYTESYETSVMRAEAEREAAAERAYYEQEREEEQAAFDAQQADPLRAVCLDLGWHMTWPLCRDHDPCPF